MTLGTFLDVAYTVLVDEYRRMSNDLQIALTEMERWRAGGPSEEKIPTVTKTTTTQAMSSEKAQALENEKALAQLQQMMAGVNFG